MDSADRRNRGNRFLQQMHRNTMFRLQDYPGRHYNFSFSGERDIVSHTELPDANYEGAHQRLNLTTAVLASYTKDEYVRDENGYPITRGGWKELNLYPITPDAAGWVLINATRSANTAENVGDLTPHNTISAGNTADNVQCWRSTSAPASGAPTGIQFIQGLYKAGTSGKIYLSFTDHTAGTVSSVGGTAGATEVLSQAAGALSIVSDVAVGAGFRVISLKINFTNKGNSLSIGAGPYSATAGQTVIIYGMSVAGAIGTGDITTKVPVTNGNPGNVVTYSSLSADLVNGRGPRVTYASAPKLLDALGGVADGTELVSNTEITTNTTGWTVVNYNVERVDSSSDPGTNSGGLDTWCLKGTAIGASGRELKTPITIAEGVNEVSFRYFTPTGDPNIYVTVGTQSNIHTSGTVSGSNAIKDTWTELVIRFVSTQTGSVNLIIGNFSAGGAIGDILYIDDIHVKSVTSAQGQIEWTGTPSGLPSAASGIIAANTTKNLLQIESTGSATVNGDRYSATLAAAFTANTESKIIIPYEPGEMRIVKDATSTVTDFSGTFGTGTVFGVGPGTAHMVHKSLKIFKRPRVTLDGMTTVYSDTISGLLISAVSGTAFLDACAAITEFADGNHLVEITDAGGKKIVAVMAAVGTGETLGSELVVNGNFAAWTGDNPDGWTLTGTENATNYITESSGKCNLISDGSYFGMTQNIAVLKSCYKSTLVIDTVTSGSLAVGFRSGSEQVLQYTTIGNKSGYLIADATAFLLKRLSGATNVIFDDVSLKQVLTPSTSGITLVSYLGSTTQSLMTFETGFTLNAASYTVTVKEMA